MTPTEMILFPCIGLCFFFIWYLSDTIKQLQNAVIDILEREIKRLEK